MNWLNELCRRLRVLFRRDSFDADLDEEMRAHLEMQAEEDCNNGMDAAEARYAAQRQFGNAALLKEDSRSLWGWASLEGLIQDLRYAIRMLGRNPGFTVVVVLTLALGIGANTAIFSLVDRLLLRPLPFPESDRLATIHYRSGADSFSWASMAYPDYAWFREQRDLFSGLAAYDDLNVQLGVGESEESVAGEIVSANYFHVLGVTPFLGRTFSPDEDSVPGRNLVVMLGHGLWQRRFGGNRDIVGQQVTINRVKFTVVGIAPPGLAGLRLDRKARPELWVPIMAYPVVKPSVLPESYQGDIRNHWSNQWLTATGRLKPGVTFDQAQRRLQAVAEQLKRDHWLPVFNDAATWSAELIPANEARFPPDSRRAVTTFLTMLMAVVVGILLVACLNVASLILANALKRRREIGVRLALGVGRRRLARQLVTESLLLTVLGGMAGLIVAYGVSVMLNRFPRPFQMQLLIDTSLDMRVLAFAMTLTIATGLLFGLLPLRQASRIDLTTVMRGGSAPAGPRRFGAWGLLVITQVALSVVLVSGAGLFVRTLRNAQAADVTRDAGRVLLVRMSGAARNTSYTQVLDRARSLPGVLNAALVYVVPMGGMRGGTNISTRSGEKPKQVDWNVVTEEYFTTIGLPIVRGRAFNSRDRVAGPPVAIVNAVMAKRFWPDEDPIGKTVWFTHPTRMAEVVGVVQDGKFRNYRAEVKPCIYAPLSQDSPSWGINLEMRTAMNPLGLAAAISREIRDVDPKIRVTEATTLEDFRNAHLGQERLSAALLSGLGLLALVISGVGVYGVLAFAVAQRTSEIGLRMALGARRGHVLRFVAGHALALVGVGTWIGCMGALLLARLVSNQLYGVTG